MAGACITDAQEPAPRQTQELKPRTTLKHFTGVLSLAFSPDGKTLATGNKVDPTDERAGDGPSIRLWDVATGKARLTVKGHTDDIRALAFTADGETLASGSSDTTVRLWGVTTGKERATLKGHTRTVLSLISTADGKMLASGSADHTVKLWDVATGELRTTL